MVGRGVVVADDEAGLAGAADGERLGAERELDALPSGPT